MILFIDVTELEEDFRLNPYKLEHIYNLGIDYWTNTIDGIYTEPFTKKEEECCLFKFDTFDFKLSNRWHDYIISSGVTGITIKFVSTKS